MAAKQGVSQKVVIESTCKACSRSVKAEIKCIICNASYHGACAVRSRGLKVVGFNELMCPTCSEKSVDDCTVDEPKNELLDELLTTIRDLKKEFKQSQDALRDEISLLQQQLEVLTSKISSNQQSTRHGAEPATSDLIASSDGAVKLATSNTGTEEELTPPLIDNARNRKNQHDPTITFKNRHNNNNVGNRKNRQNIIVGSAEVSGDENFAADSSRRTMDGTQEPKRATIYIGKIKSGVPAQVIKEYILKQCPQIGDVLVEKLPVKGKNQSFKVEIDFKLRETVMSPNLWPAGVEIRKFYVNAGGVTVTKDEDRNFQNGAEHL